MKLVITQNLPKTIDGERIGPFKKGQEVDLNDDTAKKFLESGLAVEPKAEEPKKAPAAKKSAAAKKAPAAKKDK